MNPFESTIESPLRFLSSYLQYEGESYLHKQFVSADEVDFRFIPQRDAIYVQKRLLPGIVRGELLDEETNTREFYLTFPEFVQEEFEHQYILSHNLIHEQSKLNGKDQDAKLYSMILIDCLEMQKVVDSNEHLQFSKILNDCISRILTYAHRKFEQRYPNSAEIRRVKSYYEKKKESNITGFKLKTQTRNGTLLEFIGYLRRHSFVTAKATPAAILQFFQGKIPRSKIDWAKDLHELKYFIDLICNDEILDKKPRQQWKYLDKVFSCKGQDLSKNWHRNNNKLKNNQKRIALEALATMLRPPKH